MRDVIFLVADGSIEQMLLGFLGRPQFHRSLGCGQFGFAPSDIVPHIRRDPGVYREGPELLRSFVSSHRRAVVLLDNAWEGSPGVDRIYGELSRRLRESWNQYEVIVLDPELEAWVWQDNPRLADALDCPRDFREILARSGHWPRDRAKPPDPKAALEYLRKRYRDPRRDGHRVDPGKALFKRLAARVSVRGCVDPAFLRLRDTLRDWFPEETL